MDLSEAEDFLALVQRKKMYANVTANMNPSGKLELTLVGSPENIKISIQKLKKLHKNLLNTEFSKEKEQDVEEEDPDIQIKLKKLKF